MSFSIAVSKVIDIDNMNHCLFLLQPTVNPFLPGLSWLCDYRQEAPAGKELHEADDGDVA